MPDSSIGDQLIALIRLQHIDSRIDQIKKLRGDLPEEIRDMEDEKAGLEIRLDNFKREQEENEQAHKQSEVDIKDAELLISRYEEQQLQVRNNREYDALTKEIEAQKQRIINATSKIEEIESSAEMHVAQVSEAADRLTGLAEMLDSKHKALHEVLEDTKNEQSDLERSRAEAAEEVHDRYRHAYERLRTRLRDGRAVVPLIRGAAAGYAVPPQRQVEIRQGNRIVACENTGRIIVDLDLFKSTTAEMNLPQATVE